MKTIVQFLVVISVFISCSKIEQKKENPKSSSRKKVDSYTFPQVSLQESFIDILKGRDFLSYTIDEKGIRGKVANRLKEVELVIDTISKDSVVYSFKSITSDCNFRFTFNTATSKKIWVYASIDKKVNLIRFIDLGEQFSTHYSKKSFEDLDYYLPIFYSFLQLIKSNKIQDLLGENTFVLSWSDKEVVTCI